MISHKAEQHPRKFAGKAFVINWARTLNMDLPVAGHSHAPVLFIYLLTIHWLFLIKVTENSEDSPGDYQLRDRGGL